MSDALALDSLRRRMRALFSLYEEATSSMDLAHVNHREREGVLPIAFSLFHYVNMHDASFMLITGQPPLCTDDVMASIAPAIADHGKHRTVDEMQMQQIGDYGAFLGYMAAVFARTEGWLAGIEPSELHRVLMTRPFPPQIETTFSARVAADHGMTVLDALECWIYQHGLRHMGEIELARSFVGLGGMTS